MNTLEFRFSFYASDFDRSVRFYKDVLGMQLLSGWDRPDGKGALLMVGGSAVVEIYGAADGETYSGPKPAAVHIALRLATAAEVNGYYNEYYEAGEHVEGPPEDRPWGHRSFIVYDPDGIPVHIYCEIK